MSEPTWSLLEDGDGAPYPDEVQDAFRGRMAEAYEQGKAEARADALDVEAQRRFVDWVRLWWAGPNGFPVVRAGSPEVADEDFEDMERELAAIGIRLAARQP